MPTKRRHQPEPTARRRRGAARFTTVVQAALLGLGAFSRAAVSLAAASPCTTTEACLQQVEAAQRATQTITARFTQTKHMSLLNEPLVATGRFIFKRPDRVRWQIEKPEQATVIITGDRLVIPGLPEKERQALTTLPIASALSQLSALFTGDVKALAVGFSVTAAGDVSGVHLHLVPRAETVRGMFTRIDLTFASPQLALAAIGLENKLGDRVDVRLDDVVVNAPVADSLFAEAQPP